MEEEEGLVGVKAEVREEVAVDCGWDWDWDWRVEEAGWRLGAMVGI